MDQHVEKIGRLNNTSISIPNHVIERVLTVLCEMLMDRGMSMSCKPTFADMYHAMSNGTSLMRAHDEKTDTMTHVYVHNDERVGVRHARTWMEAHPNDVVLIISLDGPTAFTRKEMDGNFKGLVEFFTFSELCVNITRHILVPRHEAIRPDDLPVEIRNTPRSTLPKLYERDKVARHYAWKPGQLVRITRLYGVDEPYYYYRIVAPNP